MQLTNNKLTIIIVAGATATGKSSIAKQLAKSLNLPVIHKDEIKETLFDGLGYDIPRWDPDAWQKKIGMGSYRVMYHMSHQLLDAGVSHIVESNFVSQYDSPHFIALQEKFGCRFIQILCKAESDVLIERFKVRTASPDRHPGHAEHTYMDEFMESLKTNKFSTLALSGSIIEIDTTDFNQVNLSYITEQIQSALNV